MSDSAISAKKRSAVVTVFLPTLIFLFFFIGTPVAAVLLIENAGGFIVFIGIVLGFILGLVFSVITYRKVYALSDFSEEKIFFRGSTLVKQSGKKESVINLSGEHISEINSGTSPTGLHLTTIEIYEGKKSIRIVGINYGFERAVQKFQDEMYIGNFPISPFEGLSASEVDATNPDALSFIDEVLALLWEYRNSDAAYRYHKNLPWNDDIKPEFSVVRVIQGESAYRENLSLIEKIKNSALYCVEESFNCLYINRDYLMICPSKKIDMKLKTRIFPLGVFPMRFIKEFRSAYRGSDHWEYIEIKGIDEGGKPHVEEVAFSVYYMEEYYKAKIMKRYLLRRNLAQEK